MKFSSIFKTTENTPATATSAWPWPTCVNSPKTLSFRASSNCKTSNILKTSNSAFVQENGEELSDCNLGSSNSFLSLRGNDEVDNCDPTENVTAGLLRSSDRLFFEPGETNSILEEAKAQDTSSKNLMFEEESVTVMAIDSCDPLLDFRVSMEEMILAHGLKNWESLEDLLTCYLKVNDKSNHGYVIGAFMDLLVNLSLTNCDEEDDDEQCDNSCSCSSTVRHGHRHLHEGSFTSPLSFCSSSCSFNSPSMEVSEGTLVVRHVSECINSCSSSSSS